MLQFEHPIISIAAALILSLLLALFIYHKDSRFKSASTSLKYLLVVLRFISISIIILLLFKPKLLNEIKQIEKDMWINIKNQATLGRRTGLGVTAVGDTLASLGIKYGSKKSIEAVESFYKCLTTNAYLSSCEMARDRGAFPIHDHSKEMGNQFLERV